MKNFFLFSICIFFLSISFSHAQVNRPFNNCYQSLFQTCDSCSDSTIITKTFTYRNCDVEVTYKLRHCHCPEPVTYIDLEFLRVSLTACSTLVCWLHPGPDPCINNTLDIQRYKEMEWSMYNALLDDLFNTDSPNYLCPNSIKYKYFYPGQCSHTCYYTVTGTEGGGVIYMTEDCIGSIGCCGMVFEYCKRPNGSIFKKYDSVNDPETCSETLIPYPTCYYNVNDPITIGGFTWYVTSFNTSSCYPKCEERHYISPEDPE